MMVQMDSKQKQGRRAALWIVFVGMFWIIATFMGGYLELSQRSRALFDLMALAGFGWALWLVYRTWQLGQNDKE